MSERINWPAVIDRAAAIVATYDTGVTLRQLHYRLVSEQLYPNTTSAYKRLSALTAIAEQIGVDQKTVSNWLGENANSRNFLEPPESRQHFDVWSFPTTDRESGGQQSYFGAVPPQVVENLLWFYTEPGQTVVDLFAGSGTTVDVAKRMGRRVWASDIRGNHYSPHLPIHVADAIAEFWDVSAYEEALRRERADLDVLERLAGGVL